MSEVGGAVESRRADEIARRQAQRVFDRPIVVEAGAGTGKTTTLVARIVVWCLDRGWERAATGLKAAHVATRSQSVDEQIAARVLERVAAITFTEAAAAEMADRVAGALAEVTRGLVPSGVVIDDLQVSDSTRRERARALLATLDHIVIRTIHSFCRRLLGKFPVEARVHPLLEVDADGHRQAEIVREVVESTIRTSVTAEGPSVLVALAAGRVGPLEIESALNDLVNSGIPAEAFAEDPFTTTRLGAARDDLRHSLECLRDAMTPLASLPARSRARATLLVLDATLAHIEATELVDAAAASALSTWVHERWVDTLHVVKEWGQGKLNQTERGALAGSDDIVAAASRARGQLEHWSQLDPQRLERGRRAVGPMLAEVYRQLRSHGFATFTALLQDASALLSRHPAVAAAVRGSIDQLLVDEFQDTDTTQCAVIRHIALAGAPGERPGLFLVGDPKQSIYGWRSANLRAYDDFVDEVLAAGGERHVLCVNYRSAPEILDEVTRVVEPIMHAATGLQPAFQPLLPSSECTARRGEARESFAPVEYWISWMWHPQRGGTLPSAALAAELEATALARNLLRLRHEQGIEWREVGVLFRSTGDLDVYLAALRAHDIPYVAEGDRQYFARREIIDAAAFVRCILDPHDQLALLTALRSPAVGVPDAAWIPLWNRNFPSLVAALHGESNDALAQLASPIHDVATALPADIPGRDRVAGWASTLIAALQQIGVLRAAFEEDPADVFVERLRTGLLLEPTEAAQTLGAYRMANLERFFRHLVLALDGGQADPQTTLRRLRTAVADTQAAEEEQPKEAAENAVRVMTIHRAKGLDFTHTYVMQLHKQTPMSDPALAVTSEQNGHFEYRLFGAATPGFAGAAAQRSAVDAAEQVRTLYVAMTRAKDRLVLAGRWPAQPRPPAPGRSHPHVTLLGARRVAPPALLPLMRTLAEERGTGADTAAARWVFPVLTLMHGAPAPLEPHGDDRAVDIDAVRSASQRLRELGMEARRHAARPFTAAAAAEETVAADALQGADDRNPSGRRLGLDPSLCDRRERITRAVGTVVHRFLESWDPATDPIVELNRQREPLSIVIRRQSDPEEMTAVWDEAHALIERFAGGACRERLRALAPHIIAREVPLMATPQFDQGPVGFVGGAIDLLYRDPQCGHLVIADFKTDRVVNDAELTARTARYRRQGAQYVRAIREFFQLEAPPRFELWFLHSGRIETVTPDEL